LDCSLVFSENFSEMLPPNGWRLGRRQSGPKWPKSPPLMTSLTKNLHPQAKTFCRVQSNRLADPFEPLNSSLAQSAEELGHW